MFPGVREYTFHKLLCYLYTDEVPAIAAARCFNLLELANRLCLPRLVNLVECRVIEDLTLLAQNDTNEAVEHCLRLLEPVKVSNGFFLRNNRCHFFKNPSAIQLHATESSTKYHASYTRNQKPNYLAEAGLRSSKFEKGFWKTVIFGSMR